MAETAARIMPGAVRLTNAIGSTWAIPAQMIAAPAIGDIDRPKEPAKAARLPILTLSAPNFAADGVTASLKANAAVDNFRTVDHRLDEFIDQPD